MTYNLSAIMTAAWKAHLSLPAERLERMGSAGRKCRFANCLKKAWYDAKQAARAAVELSPIEKLRSQILALENTDTLRHSGLQELSRLQSDLRELEAEERREATRDKRELIASANSKFCAVTFIKADGSERRMRVQPASLKFHVKGEAATNAGRRGAQTRAARHPHLMPVWDADKKAIRSVNLETVTRIAVGGQVHEFAA